MKYLKKIGCSTLYIIVSLLILTLITTVFNYFNIISDNATSIFKIMIIIISFIIGGFIIGKKSTKKGYKEGLKLGGIVSLLLIIFNYLALNNSFKAKHMLFYTIIIISCMLGSMVGIRKNSK